ncbi:MAG: mucoidy inhibitor MuiA family protein [Bacteroidota bacterium]
MKKLILLLFIPISFFANEIKIKATTKEVTVYSSGAQIHAESTVTLPKGNSIVKVTDLSQYVNQNTIQISGLKDVSVLSIGFEVVFYPKKITSEKIQNLQKEIDTKLREIALLQSQIKGLEEEETILLQNKNLSSSQQAVTLEKIQIHSKHYRERVPVIKMEIYDITKKIEILKTNLSAMHMEMSKMNGEEKEEKGEIILKFYNPNEVTLLNLDLKYNVTNAGWIPSYEIKAKNTKDALQFAYKAQVFQTTGENWNDVKLTLSTANPNVNNEKPNLDSHYLNFTYGYNNRQPSSSPVKKFNYNPLVKTVSGVVSDASGPLPGANVVVKGTTIGVQTDFSGSYTIKISEGKELTYSFLGMKDEVLPIYSNTMNVVLENNISQLQEVVVVAYGVKTKNNNDDIKQEETTPVIEDEKEVTINSVLFKIKKNYSIPSNETPSIIEIDNFNVSAEFEYYTAPILSENVFLTAKIKDWTKYDLLPGDASIYAEGSYAGTTFINPYQTEEELVVSMGIDNNLIVERKQINDLKNKSLLGSTRIIDRNYEITLRNNKAIDVDVKIYDRIPVSQNKEIKVEKAITDNAEYKEDTGILFWKLNIPSKGISKKHFSYQIKYPRSKKINL